jgi:hypothetical protein
LLACVVLVAGAVVVVPAQDASALLDLALKAAVRVGDAWRGVVARPVW